MGWVQICHRGKHRFPASDDLQCKQSIISLPFSKPCYPPGCILRLDSASAMNKWSHQRPYWMAPLKSILVLGRCLNCPDPNILLFHPKIRETYYYLSSQQHSKCRLGFHLPRKTIYTLHKLSRFQTFQDQLLAHFLHWPTNVEFCPNRAKIHHSDFQIHFCIRSSFCKSPQNHRRVAEIQSNLFQEWSPYHISHQKLPGRLVQLRTPPWLSCLICINHDNFWL